MANELILIVEDNEKNGKLVCDMLRHRGYRTPEADEDVVWLSRDYRPALVFISRMTSRTAQHCREG